MISVAVQHHPARSVLLPPLLAATGAEVVTDPAPDARPHPWRTYRHALELTPLDATHRVVLQDDVRVCRNFLPALHRAVAAQPDKLVLLYVGGRPNHHARPVQLMAGTGNPWVTMTRMSFLPVVAVCWPTPIIQPVLAQADTDDWDDSFRADDEILGAAVNTLGIVPLATAPSLVQHDDAVPSLIGLRHSNGADNGRTAACWIGNCDPLTLDWERAPA